MVTAELILGCHCFLHPHILLFFQKASFKNNTATINLAVYFFRIFGQADTFHLGTTFDNHR